MPSFFQRLKSAIVDLGMGSRPFGVTDSLDGLRTALADRYAMEREIGLRIERFTKRLDPPQEMPRVGNTHRWRWFASIFADEAKSNQGVG